MQDHMPSQTAAFVAFTRALAERGITTVSGFSDPFAGALLSHNWRRVLGFVERRLQRATPKARERTAQGIDMMVLRLLAIDAEVERAIDSGVRQLVILGAGLDTRAHRMAKLAGVTVFEIDHPATQAHKLKHAGNLPRTAKDIVYVPVHFERETIRDALAAAGHDVAAPTLWLWEGVVMYLSDHALRQTLDDVATCSAQGSVMLVHYHEPTVKGGPSALVRGLVFRILREPMIGLRTQATMRRELERVGLEVARDTSGLDWTRIFGANMPATLRDQRGTFRLAVALR